MTATVMTRVIINISHRLTQIVNVLSVKKKRNPVNNLVIYPKISYFRSEFAVKYIFSVSEP